MSENGQLTSDEGLVIGEDTTTLSTATVILNNLQLVGSTATDLENNGASSDDVQLVSSGNQMRACITLNSSADSAANLVINSDDVVLNSMAARDLEVGLTDLGANAGILAVGDNNIITLNNIPTINYTSAYQAADNLMREAMRARFVSVATTTVENEISTSGGDNTTFKKALIAKYSLSESSSDADIATALANAIADSDGFTTYVQNVIAEAAVNNAMAVDSTTFANAVSAAVADIEIANFVDSLDMESLLVCAGFENPTSDYNTIGDIVADNGGVTSARTGIVEAMRTSAVDAFAGLAKTSVTDYSECYAVKGNESTTLIIRKLVEDSTLLGKVEVGAIEIDGTGSKLLLANNEAKSGEGVLGTDIITVNCIAEDNAGHHSTSLPTEPKLEVATLQTFGAELMRRPQSASIIEMRVKHIGGLTVGDEIPLIKCAELYDENVTLVPRQTFLKQYDIAYATTEGDTYHVNGSYAARVTESRTIAEACDHFGLNHEFGRMLDSWHCTPEQLAFLEVLYDGDENAVGTVLNWTDHSDHMEKARITSSMMRAYNDVMIGRRGLHDFNQEHKLISWVSGFGDWFKQDKIKELGAKANTYGIIAGADYQLSSKWLFSLSFGYANSDVNLNGTASSFSGSGDQDSLVSSTAMTYKNKLGQGELSATGFFTSAFTRYKYNYDFLITGDPTLTTAHDKYNGFALAVGLDADWMLNFKDTAIKYGPIAQVGFDRTSQDCHATPCSWDIYSLYTDEAKVNNLWSILGAKTEYDCMFQQKKVNMYCQAGWKFNYLRNGADVGRTMALNGGGSYTATGTYVDKSMLALKLGVSLFATESLNLGIEYGLDWSSKVCSNRANIEMAYSF